MTLLVNLEACTASAEWDAPNHPTLRALLQAISLAVSDAKSELLNEDHAGSLVKSVRRLLLPKSEPSPFDQRVLVDQEIRLSALQLIATAARCNHRVFISQWENLLPDHGATAPQPITPTLFSLLLFDSSPKIRSAASFAITVLLEDARPFLLQADDRAHGAASFTAYAVRLGSVIRELHTGLYHAIQNEPLPQVLAATLKTLATLILNTPYFKLAVGSSLVEFLAGPAFSTALVHRDRSVRTNAIAALSASFSTSKPVPGMAEALSTAGRNWVAGLFSALEDAHHPTRAEALRAFAAFAHHHHIHARQHWPQLLGMLKVLVLDRDAQVRNAVVQVVEKYTQGSSEGAVSGPGDMEETIKVEQQAESPVLDPNEWQDVLRHILQPALRDTLPATRASAILCHGHISDASLQHLEGAELGALVAELVAAAAGEAPVVQGAVCRVFGGWVYHPSIIECLQYVTDIIRCLASLLTASPSLATRSRASWAYANLCDALRASRFRGLPSPDALVTQLLQTATSLADENPKVKCNVVRAVGNLGNVASADCLASTLCAGNSAIKLILQQLISAVEEPNVKVRWNGCYGIGLLLSNTALSTMLPAAQAEVAGAVVALTMALQNDENFKVRIQAGSALLGVDRQALAGPMLPTTWHAVITAMQNMHVVANFEQYKASQLLRDQLFANLRRLVDLCTPLEAVPAIHPLLKAQASFLLGALDSAEIPQHDTADLDAALAQLAVSTAEAVVSEDGAVASLITTTPSSSTVPRALVTLRQFLLHMTSSTV